MEPKVKKGGVINNKVDEKPQNSKRSIYVKKIGRKPYDFEKVILIIKNFVMKVKAANLLEIFSYQSGETTYLHFSPWRCLLMVTLLLLLSQILPSNNAS